MVGANSGQAEGRSWRRGGIIRNFGPFATARKLGMMTAVALGVAGALSFAPTVASADTGLTSIHLDCGDNYPIDAIVDTETLTDIQDVVNNMTVFPAGMTCLLSTNIVTDPLATPTTDPIFLGSGRYVAPAQADAQNPTGAGFCFYNFAVSARQKAGDVMAHGTSNVTETTQAPDGSVCPSSGGHITSDVDCLTATPATATDAATAGASGPIKNATDDFAYLETSATPSGMYTHASAGRPDTTPPATISHDTFFGSIPPCPASNGGYKLISGKVKIKTN